MLLCKLEGIEKGTMDATTIYFDRKSAIAMGSSYKYTKYTHHILRKYHYVRENIVANRFSMGWIQSKFQPEDVETKINPGPCHKFRVELIHVKVKDQHSLVQEG
jgi:hypothetical protein